MSIPDGGKNRPYGILCGKGINLGGGDSKMKPERGVESKEVRNRKGDWEIGMRTRKGQATQGAPECEKWPGGEKTQVRENSSEFITISYASV